VVCDALAEYLDAKATVRRPAGVVAETWGSLALPAQQVRELLAEEDSLFDR